MLRIVLLAVVAACSSHAPSPSSPAPSTAPAQLGKHGDVCGVGEEHRAGGGPAPVQCGPGLECCYPCGIEGCDDVCMTQRECDEPRP